MEHSPTPYTWKPLLLSCCYQSCFENFSGSRFASWEHNASSAERVLPTLGAKIGIILETSKLFAKKFNLWDKIDYLGYYIIRYTYRACRLLCISNDTKPPRVPFCSETHINTGHKGREVCLRNLPYNLPSNLPFLPHAAFLGMAL